MRPTSTFVAVTALCAVAAATYPGDLGESIWPAFATINLTLLALLLIDAWRAPARESFTLRRDHQRATTVGQAIDLTWRVEHLRNGRLVLRLADELAPSLGATTRRATFRIDDLGSATTSVVVTPSRRGRFRLRSVRVLVRGPMGLAWRAHDVECVSELFVYPSFPSRRATEARLATGRSVEAGARRSRGLGTGTEFLQLREYTPDDQFGHIDWAASARRAAPVVRTYHPEQNQTVVILVDTGRLMAANIAGSTRFDHAVDAARALSLAVATVGDRVGLVTFSDRVDSVVAPRRLRATSTLVVDHLFDVEPSLVESDYHEAFTETSAYVRRRSLLVLLTELSPAAPETGLFDALPILTRRHHVVIASVSDPAIETWAAVSPTSPTEAYRAAAAASELHDRVARLATARRLGATVVDASPGRLGVEIVEAYLSMKAAGRL